MKPRLCTAKFCSFFIFCFLVYGFTNCKKDFQERPITATSVDHSARVSGKPNIILIVANDFGFEIPTYNGGQSYSTPNLDSMAANGIQFTQCYNHPDGSPSRMAILTGKYNFRNYVRWGFLPPDEKTIGNMLNDAGYATCWVGKWQLNGGDSRIRGAGFDKYLAFSPFNDDGQRVHRYKDPKLYENGNYLPDSVTKGKYSEDMCFDYLSKFIDDNKQNSFFAVYATLLVGYPYVPTPDDPEFATWNSDNDLTLQDKKYYPGMVSYLDKMVGKVIQKLKDEGIADNTIVMFTSATQSYQGITSMWDGQKIKGTKTTTSKAGTNMPLLAYWPGKITPKKSSVLIDFTDFLPSLADIAAIPVPANYGTLDGTSFYDDLLQVRGEDRDWVFCHWDNNLFDNVPVERFINNKIYKLYDTVGEGNGKFYKIKNDLFEEHPIPDSLLTAVQKQTKAYFRSILDTMHN